MSDPHERHPRSAPGAAIHPPEADFEGSRIEVYLDGDPHPVGTYRPPARFRIDTEKLEDGPHQIRIVASDRSGHRGVRIVEFEVRNGPGIAIEGLRSGDVVEGEVSLLVNAYGGAREENWEPGRAETPAPVPTWAWLIFIGAVAWAMFYAARTWSPPAQLASTPTYAQSPAPPPGSSAGGGLTPVTTEGRVGAAVYQANCSSCHQPTGSGVPGVFPPLAGDPVIVDVDPARHIEIVLFGMQGQAIGGIDYAAPMPGWAGQLSDEEIAAVINHERTSWGNAAPLVSVDDVAEVRRQRAGQSSAEGAANEP
jgi:mono/diheme cytochrome c family protein